MAKYNINEKKVKKAAYRDLVSPAVMDALQSKILQKIVVERKYRDKDYSAKQLAQDIGTSARYISAVVSVRFHKNYTEFVNSYRVEEAMSLLVDRRYQELNIEDISAMVGFANRQSFYAAFYRFNKMTPRQYKLRQLAEHPTLKKEEK